VPVTVHPFTVLVPLLFTVNFACKPPCHDDSTTQDADTAPGTPVVVVVVTGTVVVVVVTGRVVVVVVVVTGRVVVVVVVVTGRVVVVVVEVDVLSSPKNRIADGTSTVRLCVTPAMLYASTTVVPEELLYWVRVVPDVGVLADDEDGVWLIPATFVHCSIASVWLR
jgi:hypothetical protein